jgi:poly-beta-hydroxybutyrate-responsive repressor
MSETMSEKLEEVMNTIADQKLEAASEVKETVEPNKPVKGVRFVDEPEAPVVEKKPVRKPAAKKVAPSEPKLVVSEPELQQGPSEEVKAASKPEPKKVASEPVLKKSAAEEVKAAPKPEPKKVASEPTLKQTPVKEVKAALLPEPELEDLDEGQKKDKGEEPFSFAPKTFLQPYMLLILRQWNTHGYEVWERLMQMGFPGFDHNDRATVYRALRQLEREGKVKSVWDTKTEGPARRVYSLTAAGEEFLKFWASGLDQYRKTLDFFFKMYTGGLLPSPFSFNPLMGESDGKKDKKK